MNMVDIEKSLIMRDGDGKLTYFVSQKNILYNIKIDLFIEVKEEYYGSYL